MKTIGLVILILVMLTSNVMAGSCVQFNAFMAGLISADSPPEFIAGTSLGMTMASFMCAMEHNDRGWSPTEYEKENLNPKNMTDYLQEQCLKFPDKDMPDLVIYWFLKAK